jgi:protein required for attachment to host cells
MIQGDWRLACYESVFDTFGFCAVQGLTQAACLCGHDGRVPGREGPLAIDPRAGLPSSWRGKLARFVHLRRLAVEEHKDPPSREQGSDAPGRAYSGVGEIRSAVGETDWHELEKERFAASIADRINKVALSGGFNQLVIVAPPKILGELRRKFTKETETKIIAEVPKDLTHHTIPEIERLLTAK